MASLILLLTKLMPLWKALGSALLAIGAQLLAGRAFKKLILSPFEWIARKTGTKEDDKIINDIKQDLGLDPTEETKDGKES